MTYFSYLIRRALFFLLVIITNINSAAACTGMQIQTKDGSFVNGRTVEFSTPINLSEMFVPRNYEFKGTLPDGSAGLHYRSKYAAVGAITFGAPAIVDGINEKGLSVGMFYFPGYAKYTTVTPQNKSKALSPIDFTNWIITQFATVDEVKQHLSEVIIAPTTPPGWPGLPPFHYIVYDKTGKSIIIEPINGKLQLHENPLGVFTNSPTFEWHMTNLANYINLSTVNAAPVEVDGVKLKQLGAGSGLHGLPGDFTPPSRFVRAAIFSSSAVPAANNNDAVMQIFHLLNQFDIPVGSVRTIDGKTIEDESTLATTVKDPNSLKYYVKTYQDQNIRVTDLQSFDFDSKALMYINIDGKTNVTDISRNAKPTIE